MSALREADTFLGGDVVAHLDAQLAAARRLLGIVLEQGTAIRNRDVRAVVTLTGVLHAELQRRQALEDERARLLERAGARLGVSPGAVTLALIEGLVAPGVARRAHERSSELQGLLEEVRREHYVNRVLMNQELSFLDHLLRLAHGADEQGYDSAGDRPSAATRSGQHRMLDVEV